MAENKKSALGWGLERTPQRGRGKENHAPGHPDKVYKNDKQ